MSTSVTETPAAPETPQANGKRKRLKEVLDPGLLRLGASLNISTERLHKRLRMAGVLSGRKASPQAINEHAKTLLQQAQKRVEAQQIKATHQARGQQDRFTPPDEALKNMQRVLGMTVLGVATATGLTPEVATRVMFDAHAATALPPLPAQAVVGRLVMLRIVDRIANPRFRTASGHFNWQAFALYAMEKAFQHEKDVTILAQLAERALTRANIGSMKTQLTMTQQQVLAEQMNSIASIPQTIAQAQQQIIQEKVDRLSDSKFFKPPELLQPGDADRNKTAALHDKARLDWIDRVSQIRTVDPQDRHAVARLAQRQNWGPSDMRADHKIKYEIKPDVVNALAQSPHGRSLDHAILTRTSQTPGEGRQVRRILLAPSEVEGLRQSGHEGVLLADKYEKEIRDGGFEGTRLQDLPGKIMAYEREIRELELAAAHAKQHGDLPLARQFQSRANEFKPMHQNALRVFKREGNAIMNTTSGAASIREQIEGATSQAQQYRAIADETRLKVTNLNGPAAGHHQQSDDMAMKAEWAESIAESLEGEVRLMTLLHASYRGGAGANNPTTSAAYEPGAAQERARLAKVGTHIDGRSRRSPTAYGQEGYDAIWDQINHPKGATPEETIVSGESAMRKLETFLSQAHTHRIQACELHHTYRKGLEHHAVTRQNNPADADQRILQSVKRIIDKSPDVNMPMMVSHVKDLAKIEKEKYQQENPAAFDKKYSDKPENAEAVKKAESEMARIDSRVESEVKFWQNKALWNDPTKDAPGVDSRAKAHRQRDGMLRMVPTFLRPAYPHGVVVASRPKDASAASNRNAPAPGRGGSGAADATATTSPSEASPADAVLPMPSLFDADGIRRTLTLDERRQRLDAQRNKYLPQNRDLAELPGDPMEDVYLDPNKPHAIRDAQADVVEGSRAAASGMQFKEYSVLNYLDKMSSQVMSDMSTLR